MELPPPQQPWWEPGVFPPLPPVLSTLLQDLGPVFYSGNLLIGAFFLTVLPSILSCFPSLSMYPGVTPK